MERYHQVGIARNQISFSRNTSVDHQRFNSRRKDTKNHLSPFASTLPIVAGITAFGIYKEVHAQQCRISSGGLCECPHPNADPHQEPVWMASPGKCNDAANSIPVAAPQAAPSQGFVQNEQVNGVGISVCQDRQDAASCICLTTQGTTVNVPLDAQGCVAGAVDRVWGTLPSIYYKTQQSAPVQYNSAIPAPQAVEQLQVQAEATTPPVNYNQVSKTITREKINHCCAYSLTNVFDNSCPKTEEICSETARNKFGWTIVEANSGNTTQQSGTFSQQIVTPKPTPTQAISSVPAPEFSVDMSQLGDIFTYLGIAVVAIGVVKVGLKIKKIVKR